MKLNQKHDPALPYLGAGLLFVIGGFFLVWVGLSEIFLISWFASLVAPFVVLAGLATIVYSLWRGVANSVHAGQRAVALRTLPSVPPTIRAAAGLFNSDNIPRVTTEAPTISGKAIDYFDNQNALKTHVAYLNDIHGRAVEALKPVPERYKADQMKVEAQQLVLYRMAHQAAGVARRLEANFPKLKADLTSVPQPKAIILPAPPKLESLANLDQRQKNFNAATARAIGQGINQGGATGAVIAIAASVAIGVIAFQKQVRAVEQAHGQVSTFINGAVGDIEVLGLAHAELLTISNEIFRQSNELRTLLLWAKDADKQGRFATGAALSTDERANITTITTYAMIARIESARAV